MALDTILTADDFTAWDVTDHDKLDALIGDVLSQAVVVAPCLDAAEFAYARAAKAILREAVLRRLDAGSGALTTRQQGTGPFSQMEVIDQRSNRTILRPADISQLQALCSLHNGEVEGPRLGAINLDPAKSASPGQRLIDRPDLWFQINVPWGYP